MEQQDAQEFSKLFLSKLVAELQMGIAAGPVRSMEATSSSHSAAGVTAGYHVGCTSGYSAEYKTGYEDGYRHAGGGVHERNIGPLIQEQYRGQCQYITM